MTGRRVLLVLIVVAGFRAVPALAQGGPGSRPPELSPGVKVDGGGTPYRPWDVTVSGGLHVDNEVGDVPDDRQVTVLYDDDWRAGLGIQADLGRYWTSHLKTEVSLAFLTGHEVFGADVVPVPTGEGQAFYQTDIARTHIGAAVTYQFFDNVFAHPYVSGGVRMSIFDRHKVRNGSAWVSDRLTSREYPIPPLEVRDRDVSARPYVAVGFKSYFDERAFVRSEWSTAFSDRGAVHWVLRLGFGVDF